MSFSPVAILEKSASELDAAIADNDAEYRRIGEVLDALRSKRGALAKAIELLRVEFDEPFMEGDSSAPVEETFEVVIPDVERLGLTDAAVAYINTLSHPVHLKVVAAELARRGGYGSDIETLLDNMRKSVGRRSEKGEIVKIAPNTYGPKGYAFGPGAMNLD